MEDYPENITLVIHVININEDNINDIPIDDYFFVEEKDIIVEDKENSIEDKDIIVEEKDIFVEDKENSVEEKDIIVEEKENSVEEKDIIVEEKENSIEEAHEIVKAEIAIQTDEIIVEEIIKAEIAIQTDEIIIEEIVKSEIAIQTDEIIVEEIVKSEIAIQTDEIIIEEIAKAEIAIQTDEIIIEEIVKEEIAIQTDIISNNDIETQTEYIMEIKEDIKQILPDILIQNLSHDILLQIHKVLSSKKKESYVELEEEYKEIERKKEEKILRLCTPLESVVLNEESGKNNHNQIPSIIFIIPYRDREQQYNFFHRQMTKEILVDYPIGSYKLWYIHQCDTRDFNRGAMKNIGFLVVKQQYPNDYKNITLVFNDVDTMPLNRNFLNYETSPGIIKHFYGYDFALGGIVSMNAHDFERINGYPNLWGWGFEDNCLQVRVNKADNLRIDRSQFYPILNKNILQITDGVTRIVNRNEFDQYYHNTTEGIYSITDLQYDIDDNNGFVNIRNFNTGREQDLAKRKVHDLRNGPAPFNPNNDNKNRNNRKKTMMGLLF